MIICFFRVVVDEVEGLRRSLKNPIVLVQFSLKLPQILVALAIINNCNKTTWSPIRSHNHTSDNKMGRPRGGSPIC